MIGNMTELERVREECRRLVTRRSLTAAGVAIVPVPGADFIVDIGILTTLLPTISSRFGLDHEQVARLEPHLAQKVAVLASGMGNSLIGRMVTKRLIARLLRRAGVRIATASVAKYVPFVGSAIAAGVSFGAMKMVGNAHVEDCYRTVKEMLADPG